MDDDYSKIVVVYPPKKSGDLVLLTMQTKEGEVLRLALSASIAKNLGTQMLLVGAREKRAQAMSATSRMEGCTRVPCGISC